jgi:hypothetical protein
MSLRSTSLLSTLLFLVCAASGLARVEDTLRQARAYLGPDAVLDQVQSLRFFGSLSTIEDTPEGPRPVTAQVEILFQRPMFQRIVATSTGRVETTALDDYEGWQRVVDPANPTNWQLTLLAVDQVKRLRANTWENLAFYRGIERRGGRIEDRGFEQINGQRAHKLAFIHAPDIIFHRYFDARTGRLLLTETEAGGRIREEGEIRAGGIRFPARVITSNTLPDGTERAVTVTFDRIEVNQPVSPQTFAMPPLSGRNP